MKNKPFLILASSSPRRQEMLRSLGVRFQISATSVDESNISRSGAEMTAMELAGLKARACTSDNQPVLAMDTIVAVGRRIMGKPANIADARRMLELLSGRKHRVITGVALRQNKRMIVESETTIVQFRKLAAAEIQRYIDTGEPFDKAGAYAAQGLGRLFVTGIHGCFYNVVGFPVQAFLRALNKLRFSVYDFMD